jgi:hypothetical protein
LYSVFFFFNKKQKKKKKDKKKPKKKPKSNFTPTENARQLPILESNLQEVLKAPPSEVYEEPEVIDSRICPTYEFHTTNVETEPLDTLSGGYNGNEFIYSKNNSVESMVAGTVVINGLSEPLDASFIFSSYRYEEANYYEETLKIITKKGAVLAEALYVDKGDGLFSVAPYADYDVHTSWGEFRNTKGHKIRIYFDNTKSCKPRTLALVQGFGSSSIDANLRTK